MAQTDKKAVLLADGLGSRWVLSPTCFWRQLEKLTVDRWTVAVAWSPAPTSIPANWSAAQHRPGGSSRGLRHSCFPRLDCPCPVRLCKCDTAESCALPPRP